VKPLDLSAPLGDLGLLRTPTESLGGGATGQEGVLVPAVVGVLAARIQDGQAMHIDLAAG